MKAQASSKRKVILIGLDGLMPELVDRYKDRIPHARTLMLFGWLVAVLPQQTAAGRDHAFYGVARGRGKVVMSPARGFSFDSPRVQDVAYAVTTEALPMCYSATIAIDGIDVVRSGCRFGIFNSAAQRPGDNDAINLATKYAVAFQESRGERMVYVWHSRPDGQYACWDGRQWRLAAWRSTGMRWQPSQQYRVSITKSIDAFECRVSNGNRVLVEPRPISVTEVRSGGGPDHLAFGDLVTDFVQGQIDVASVHIEELAMRPYLDRDMNRVVVRQAPSGRYAMYGGLTSMPDGSIVCVYKVGSRDKSGSPWTVRDETIVWTRSPDGGRTWPDEEKVIYADKSTRQENCCGTGYRTPDGRLIHPFYILNPDYEERAKANNWSFLQLAETSDGGRTWSIRRLDTPFAMPASFGGALGLRDGTVLLNVYGTGKLGTFRHQAGVMLSGDHGKTWSDFSLIGAKADPDGGPARLNETSLAELPNGTWLTMSRTQYSGFPLYRALSADRGRTWSVSDSGLTGLCPSLCLSQTGPPEGIVTLVYHDRWREHADQGGVYIAFSTDGGSTWGYPLWISPGAYPCTIETQPGRMLTVYYKSSDALHGTHFPAPFPSGLRAMPEAGRVAIEWDRYAGQEAESYAYHVHRSTRPFDDCSGAEAVGVVHNANAQADGATKPGRVYYYRVQAKQGDRVVGQSWLTVARAQ